MHRVLSHRNQLLFSTLAFALAAAVRSNGALCAGYVVVQLLVTAYHRRRALLSMRGLVYALGAMLATVLIVLPLVVHDSWAQHRFCQNVDDSRDFCQAVAFWQLGAAYASVQRRYWQVGLFTYYQWRFAPNFVLAAPVLWWSGRAVWRSLSRLASPPGGQLSLQLDLAQFTADRSTVLWAAVAIHHAALAVVALTVMHVEVATRLLCSSTPLLYWYAASADYKRFAAFSAFAMFYAIVGVCLHSQFLPWT